MTKLENDYWALYDLRNRWGNEVNPITWREFFDVTTRTLMDIIEKVEKIETGNNDDSQGT